MARMVWLGLLVGVGCSGDDGAGTDDSAPTSGAASVDTECLDAGCDLTTTATVAWSLCSDATEDAPDTSVSWGETRYMTGTGGFASGIVWTCASSVLVEDDCPGLCTAGNLGSPYYNPYAQDCTCLKSTDDTGDLAESLATTACGDTNVDVNVGLSTPVPGDPEVSYVASMTCGSGDSLGVEACEAAGVEAGSGLNVSFSTATGGDVVCTLTEP